MATEAVLLNSFRARIAAHMAGEIKLAPISHVAFGDGGHDANLNPIQPSENATALKHEVLRKKISSISRPETLAVTGKGTIENHELVGVRISEAALVDADGKLIGIKTFAPKVKEDDERYQIEITVRF